MSLSFPLILTGAVVVTGLICLADRFFFAPRRASAARAVTAPNGAVDIEVPVIIDYARSFFPVLLIVLIIRSFIAQPFVVPTGSLEPTVLPGDFILVNQFAFGLRLPVLNTEIIDTGKPKLGDLAVFRWPVDPSIDFVKRVAGMPGDHIVYKDKVLSINGKVAPQKFIGMTLDLEPKANLLVEEKEEDMNGVIHRILINPHAYGSGRLMGFDAGFNETVPEKSYFMLGDNRDASGDSRYWGFVPEANLVGKPEMVLFSWDRENHKVRWERIGLRLR